MYQTKGEIQLAYIQYRDISKNYGMFPALTGINLDIGEGRIVGLLGPNGSGKTTLIKLTAGLIIPSGGNIKVCGEPIGVQSKKLISYLPERTYLDETLTAEKTLGFFSDFYEDFDIVKARELMKQLDIDPKRKIKTMSKGGKEKLQLALVMSRHAKVYLLDEPIAGVDPAAREFILNTILKNYAENSTVVISTHLIADVENVLDDAIFLSYGKIILASPVEELKAQHGKTIDQLFREVFRC